MTNSDTRHRVHRSSTELLQLDGCTGDGASINCHEAGISSARRAVLRRPAKPDLYTRECIKNAYLAACAGAMGTAEGWLMRAGY